MKAPFLFYLMKLLIWYRKLIPFDTVAMSEGSLGIYKVLWMQKDLKSS